MPRYLVTLIVAIALFMETMDTTVIATSLPVIARDLHQNPVALKLALTSYLLSLAIFIPMSGWTADRFGARTIFRTAIAIFALGSALCGFSHSLVQLVVFRILQGLGGAMMVPVGRLVILRSVPKKELITALAWLTIPALTGPVLGPPLGGFITTYFSWHWIFWINVPVGLLGIVLATLYVTDIREEKVPPLDIKGVILSGIGLSGLAFGFTTIGQGLLPTPVAIGLLVIGAVTCWLYVRHAKRTPHPILDLDLLKIPTFYASVVGGSLFRIGIGAGRLLLPLLFQVGFGLNPLQSGLLTCTSAIGAITMKTTASPILHRFGFRRVLLVNAAISAFFIAAYAAFTPQTPYLVIIVVLMASGFFRSLEFTSVQSLAYADIDTKTMSRATSFASVAQQLAVSTGIALGALVLEAQGFHQVAKPAGSGPFVLAFLVVAGASLSSILIFRILPEGAGGNLSRRPHLAEEAEENSPFG